MQLCEKYVTAEQSSEQRDNVQFTDEEREKYK